MSTLWKVTFINRCITFVLADCIVGFWYYLNINKQTKKATTIIAIGNIIVTTIPRTAFLNDLNLTAYPSLLRFHLYFELLYLSFPVAYYELLHR